ncbi:hypothetical protein NQ317_010880 [Molorchus minor]|uniref:Receptor ligand binding region domain-containing protein n=1 Tax=Molorchus minor TaxID=1323400 RepID=A0ABQ9JDB1_9CUCU|nr:hypothetical protein NQ317_010880 [Molorchus minor]
MGRYVLASALRDLNQSKEITEAPKDCDNSGSIWETGKNLFNFIRKQVLINGETGKVAFDDQGDRINAEYDLINIQKINETEEGVENGGEEKEEKGQGESEVEANRDAEGQAEEEEEKKGEEEGKGEEKGKGGEGDKGEVGKREEVQGKGQEEEKGKGEQQVKGQNNIHNRNFNTKLFRDFNCLSPRGAEIFDVARTLE